MSLFDFEDYKPYVMARIRAMPRNGRGEFRRISQHLGVHSTLVSHVFRGTVELNLEQAASLSKYLGLNELEGEYFLGLVQLARAGSAELRAMLNRRLDQLRTQSIEVSKRIQARRQLDEKDKALFYSEWFFSAIRLLCAIPGFQDPDHIAAHLGLGKNVVHHAVEFLLETGLCQIKDGKLEHAVQTTHVPADSPLASRHHKNWRLKAMENYSRLATSELAFTMPVALSQQDATKIRKILVDYIQEIDQVFEQSPSEKLYCLNIDWFHVK